MPGAPGCLPQYTLQKSFGMTHASEISAARRYGQLLADRAGLAATEAGRLAIVVTEAGTNILKHADDGWLVFRDVALDGRRGVEVIAIDRGPGIINLGQSLRDGVSTAGTAGTGLGAMRRLADAFDIYSLPGVGTAVYMVILKATTAVLPGHAVDPADALDRVGAAGAVGAPGTVEAVQAVDAVGELGPFAATAPRLMIGAMCLPISGEEACGDAWGVEVHGTGLTIVVADGLGHGPGAAEASHAAIRRLHEQPSLLPAGLLQAMHADLRTTRGAAAAVVHLDFLTDQLRFAGIGNLTACIVGEGHDRQLVSHNGIVGHNMRKVQEFTAPWHAGELAILCSDGIGTQWDLSAFPGLLACHPALIAGVLYRDFQRPRDDATVLVIKRLH